MKTANEVGNIQAFATQLTGRLHESVLVLNKNWQAINVAPVPRALTMLWNDAAKVVDTDSYQTYSWADWADLIPKEGEPYIQSVRRRFRVPDVITLTVFDKLPTAAVTFSRRNIFKRDHYTCQYCGVQPGNEDLTIDHVNPRALGGISSWTNCVLACVRCNVMKADRPLEKTGLKLKRPPVRPDWKPIYTSPRIRKPSWAKFISEAYWNVPLVE